MNAGSEIEPPKEESKPARVLDGEMAAQGTRGFRRPYHAASGASILALDWLLFSGNILSGGMASLPTMVLGFALGSVSTALIQRFVAGDSIFKSLAKALAAGLIVGAPTPVAGTALGGVILAVSGLSKSKLKSKIGKP